MAKRLFVGNLPFNTTAAQLEEVFSQAGAIEKVDIVTDRYTGQGKGFAFVEMVTEEDAQKAIKTLAGYNLGGRTIVVNEARPREERPMGGGFGGGGFGGGDRGGFHSRGGGNDRGGYGRGPRR